MLHNDKVWAHKLDQRLGARSRSRVTHFFKLSLVILSFVGLVRIGQRLYNPLLFPIRYVKILGGGSEQLNAALQKEIGPFIKNGLPCVKVQIFESQLKQWTWVKRVTRWRILPGILIIHVQSRTPVAIFQSAGEVANQATQLLDKTGCFFEPAPYVIPTHLPKLIGAREQSTDLLRCYQALEALLRPQSLQITTVRLDVDNRCCVELTNGIQLLLGHLQPYKQLQQLLDVHPSVLHQADKIAILDLRYPTGMAVTWRESTL